jgi:hypothetical protein
MAPVAGRVADAEQNRLVFAFGPRQGFFAPGVPLHGIVGMLKQVGTGFVYQGIRMLLGCHGLSLGLTGQGINEGFQISDSRFQIKIIAQPGVMPLGMHEQIEAI